MADQIELENSQTFVDGNGVINLPTGKLSLHSLRQVLNMLPFEIDFANADDELVYYSAVDNRVNARSQKSLGKPFVSLFAEADQDAVQNMLTDFHNGAASYFEQWFPKNDKTIYANYYAVRDVDGTFLGTLQFTGDITRIQGFRGIRTAFNSGKSDK